MNNIKQHNTPADRCFVEKTTNDISLCRSEDDIIFRYNEEIVKQLNLYWVH